MKTKNTYAKVIILCTAVITFFGVGIFANSLSTWTPTAYTSLGVSLTLFSVYYTFQNGTLAISQIFVGRLINKVKFRPLIMASVTLSCAALALMSVWPNVYCWWISGVLNGLGLSVHLPLLQNRRPYLRGRKGRRYAAVSGHQYGTVSGHEIRGSHSACPHRRYQLFQLHGRDLRRLRISADFDRGTDSGHSATPGGH